MKNKIKILMLFLSMFLLLGGCKKHDNIEENLIKPDDNYDEQINNKDDEASEVEPVQSKELPIYTIDIDSGDTVLVVSLISSEEEVTPELIIDKVIDAMEDISLLVGIYNIEEENDTIIVSFKSDMAPVENVGSGTEVAILDAIAQSLMENLDNYNKVIYRIEDEAYSTGHMELDFDEIYLSK